MKRLNFDIGFWGEFLDFLIDFIDEKKMVIFFFIY